MPLPLEQFVTIDLPYSRPESPHEWFRRPDYPVGNMEGDPQVIAAWERFLDRVRIGGRCPITCHIRDTYPRGPMTSGPCLELRMSVDDTYTGDPTLLRRLDRIPNHVLSEREMRLFLKHSVLALYCHEACEHIMIDGDRVFDPHVVGEPVP